MRKCVKWYAPSVRRSVIKELKWDILILQLFTPMK